MSDPRSFLFHRESTSHFERLFHNISSVDEQSPLIKPCIESLFVWFDAEDLSGLLMFAKNLKGWGQDHREIQVLSCLEKSARTWGHKVPYSYVCYLYYLLMKKLPYSSKKRIVIDEYFSPLWKSYHEFEDKTDLPQVVEQVGNLLNGYRVSKVGEHCLKQYLSSGSLPSYEERREYIKSLSRV